MYRMLVNYSRYEVRNCLSLYGPLSYIDLYVIGLDRQPTPSPQHSDKLTMHYIRGSLTRDLEVWGGLGGIIAYD